MKFHISFGFSNSPDDKIVYRCKDKFTGKGYNEFRVVTSMPFNEWLKENLSNPKNVNRWNITKLSIYVPIFVWVFIYGPCGLSERRDRMYINSLPTYDLTEEEYAMLLLRAVVDEGIPVQRAVRR